MSEILTVVLYRCVPVAVGEYVSVCDVSDLNLEKNIRVFLDTWLSRSAGVAGIPHFFTAVLHDRHVAFG